MWYLTSGLFCHILPLVSLADVAPLAEQSCPQLDPNNPKYEEDEKAEQQHIAQHRQGVKEQHHKDPHA